MADFLKTALLLEEKASKLPRDSYRRAEVLAFAQAARRLGLELRSVDFELERNRPSAKKRAHTWGRLALKMPDGAEKAKLQCMAEAAAIHDILDHEGGDQLYDCWTYRLEHYCAPRS